MAIERIVSGIKPTLNLFDNEYVDFGNIPQPGRWMRAGVKITI